MGKPFTGPALLFKANNSVLRRKASESPRRERPYHLQQLLVVVVLHLATVVEEHRGSSFFGIGIPLRQAFCVGIARAGEVQPGTAHLLGQGLRFGAAARHGGVDHGIVEGERYLHAVRAAEHAVEHRRFPGEHVHIDRSALLCGFQSGLLHRTGTEYEIHIYQILGLVVGVSLREGGEEVVRGFRNSTAFSLVMVRKAGT